MPWPSSPASCPSPRRAACRSCPGYVSYVSGVASSGSDTVAVQARVLGASLLFVLGFATVFTALGAAVSSIGGFLLPHRQSLIRVAGLFVVLTGLVTMGAIRVPALSREVRLDLRRVRPGPLGAVPLGMAFAVGWTQCIGPVLAGILTAAATTQGAWRGASLLFMYSLGLGIPFLLLAVGYTKAGGGFAWFRRQGRAVEVLGGAVLVAMGLLMVTGQWLRLSRRSSGCSRGRDGRRSD